MDGIATTQSEHVKMQAWNMGYVWNVEDSYTEEDSGKKLKILDLKKWYLKSWW